MASSKRLPLIHDAARRATRYLETLNDRPVAPTPEALAALERFEEPFPEVGHGDQETLAMLDDLGSPATMANAGGRYFGFVTGGALPASLAAHILASAWDQNAALPAMSPVAARLQSVTSAWLVEALGLPRGSSALFVGGASVANLCALVAGRDHLLSEAGHDVRAQGLFGAPEINVVVSESTHSTMAKVLSIAGLGRDRVIEVPADEQGRLRAELLPDLLGPTIVCAQAGEVNSGAFDPFSAIVSWARRRNAWVHVDGAFGLWAAASQRRRHLLEGVAGADSWTTDGHKWLNVPYDSGIIVMRNVRALRRSMAISAAYLPTASGAAQPIDAMNHTPQSSQRARVIDTWAALRTLGRRGLADLVDRTCAHAERFAEKLREAGFEILNDVVLNQVLVSFGSDDRTDAVSARLQSSGECWCGPTTWQGRRALRISVSSWATTEADVDRSVAAMIEAARFS